MSFRDAFTESPVKEFRESPVKERTSEWTILYDVRQIQISKGLPLFRCEWSQIGTGGSPVQRTVNLQRRFRGRHYTRTYFPDHTLDRDVTDNIAWPSCVPTTNDPTQYAGREDDPYEALGQIKTLTFGQVSSVDNTGAVVETRTETRFNELDIAGVFSGLKARVLQDSLDELWANAKIRAIGYDDVKLESPGVDGAPNGATYCPAYSGHTGAEQVGEFNLQVFGPRPATTGQNVGSSTLKLDVSAAIVRSQVKFFQPTDYSIIEVATGGTAGGKLPAKVLVETAVAAEGQIIDIPLPSFAGFGFINVAGAGEVLLSDSEVWLVVGQSGSGFLAPLVANEGYVQVPSWG